MSISKQITIYEPPDTTFNKLHTENIEFGNIDLFTNDELRRHNKLTTADIPIISTMPSMLIKNIVYNIMPIIEPSHTESPATYKMHVQLPIPIKVAILTKGTTVKRENDIISMIGFYFDSESTFFQFTPIKGNLTNLAQKDQFFLGAAALRDIAAIYNYIPLPRTCAHFTQQKLKEALKPIKFAIKFNNDEDALQKIQSIITLVNSRAMYFRRMYKYIVNSIYGDPQSLVVNVAQCVAKRKTIGISDAIFVMEKLTNISLHDKEPGIVTSTLKALGLYFVYVRLVLNGTKSANTLIQQSELDASVTRDLMTFKKQMYINNARDAWYNNIAMREFQLNYSILTTSQQETVTNQYKQEYDISIAIRTNKCPHLPLQRQVMRFKNEVFDVEAWNSLKKFVPLDPAPKKNDITTMPTYTTGLQCNLCHLWGLCPHHYVMFDMKDTMFEGSDEKMMDYLILHFSIDKQSEDDTYFCRICGETLKKNMVEGEIWASIISPSSGGGDALNNIIATEVFHTLNTNIVTGTVSIDNTVLANNIVNVISPFIYQYETKLNRGKTNTEAMIRYSLHLIISAYVLVVIVYLSSITGGEITLKNAKIKGLTGVDMLHALFNQAYKLLVFQKMVAIDNVPAFTPDRIKKILTRGFQQVSGSHIMVETTVLNDHFDETLSTDPIYQFLYYGWVMAAAIDKKPRPMLLDSQTIIGTPIENIKNLKMMFEKASMPPKWDTEDAYYWDSYSAVAKRIISNTYIMNATHKAAIHKEQNVLIKRWNDIMKKRANMYNIRSSMPNTWTMRKENVPIEELLLTMYCTDGKLHKWDIFVYKGENGKSVDVKVGQFGKIDITNMDYFTQKCAVCGDIFGKTKPVDIVTIVSNNKTRESFYRYYTDKCPIKYIHTYTNGTCTQCGITKHIKKTNDKTYFNKYKSVYEQLKSYTDGKNIIQSNRRGMVVIKKSKTGKLYKPWVYTNDNIVTLSKTMRISYNLLINIGLISKYNYEDIEKSKFNPSSSVENNMWILHISAVGAAIINFVSKYNRFVRCSVVGMHADLQEICKTMHSDVQLLTPIDLTEYFTERVCRSKDIPRLYANWILSQLCSMILRIYNAKDHAVINKKFANLFIGELLETELNNSKPKLHKRTVASAKDATDNFNTDNMGRVEINDIMAKESIDAVGEAFDTSDIDVSNMEGSYGHDVI
jgi:hypothetical protein